MREEGRKEWRDGGRAGRREGERAREGGEMRIYERGRNQDSGLRV
jgi:hypothetical protein